MEASRSSGLQGPARSSVLGPGLLSATFSDDMEDEEESVLYDKLHDKELECGVHDEDFLEPLFGALKFATTHAQRHMTVSHTKTAVNRRGSTGTVTDKPQHHGHNRHHPHHPLLLECEDRSVNMLWAVENLTTERRQGADGTAGLALMLPDGEDLRVVLFEDASLRDSLEKLLTRLREDPRGYRRRRHKRKEQKRGVSCSCVPKCNSIRTRRRPASAPAKSGLARDSLANSKAYAPFRAYARRVWDSGISAQPRRSITDMATFRAKGSGTKIRKQSVEIPQRLPAPKPSIQADLLHELLVRTPLVERETLGLTSTQSRFRTDWMTGSHAPSLVLSLLRADIVEDPSALTFDNFWEVAVELLLFKQLAQEPFLAEKFAATMHAHPEVMVMNLKQWEWFLVKQDETRPFVEKAESMLLQEFEEPEVLFAQDGVKAPPVSMTMFGLVRYLCSIDNSLLTPKRGEGKVYQDMSKPLSDYWIYSAHHTIEDSSGEITTINMEASVELASSMESSSMYRSDAERHASEQELNFEPLLEEVFASGCRCFSLALTSPNDYNVDVLLTTQHVPLATALSVLERVCFPSDGSRTMRTARSTKTASRLEHVQNPAMEAGYPVVLVLSMARLPPLACNRVAEILKESLPNRLFPAVATKLPSPEEAKGMVVVILAPGPDNDPLHTDMSLLDAGNVVRNRDNMTRGLSHIATATGDALKQSWERKGATNFAVLSGYWLDPSSLEAPLPEVASAGFAPSDELQALIHGGVHTSRMVERHACRLALTFPVMPRTYASNFNPAPAWAVGVQMAALALGRRCTDGAGIAHAARFAYENGGCGYVLKPQNLRSPGLQQKTVPATLRIELRVIAARAIPGTFTRRAPGADEDEEAPDKVMFTASIWGSGNDSARRSYTPVKAQGPIISWPESSPSWPKEKAVAFTVTAPSVAVLVLEVFKICGKTGKRSLAACYGAPADAIRSGYRWVPLWAPELLPPRPIDPISGLLVHVSLEVKRRVVRTAGLDSSATLAQSGNVANSTALGGLGERSSEVAPAEATAEEGSADGGDG
mmetsp:Transcript_9262/g.20718  ORF Transcript_9262/g.20718 Transcript_9262/m.20718 type:complete len:1051 (-) Transcript_9262:118-3270(-)